MKLFIFALCFGLLSFGPMPRIEDVLTSEQRGEFTDLTITLIKKDRRFISNTFSHPIYEDSGGDYYIVVLCKTGELHLVPAEEASFTQN